MIDTLAIVGLGLMGGSLGLAAKARGTVKRVVAYSRREESRRKALEQGVADAVFDSPGDAVDGADLVVLCTPDLTMPELVRGFKERLHAGCVVTDVGSTKAFLDRELGAILADSPAVFVGSHPMAGSEKTGVDAARVDLYQGARVIVTGETAAESVGVQRVTAFWEQVGAYVSVMTPEEHDAVIARTSHLDVQPTNHASAADRSQGQGSARPDALPGCVDHRAGDACAGGIGPDVVQHIHR